MDCSPPGSSVHGILQARILEWAVLPPLQGIFPIQGLDSSLLLFPALAGRFFTSSSTREGQSTFVRIAKDNI